MTHTQFESSPYTFRESAIHYHQPRRSIVIEQAGLLTEISYTVIK